MNILLLPELDNNQSSINITERSQISHIQQVLELKVGDSLKVGSVNGRLGTAVIESVSDTKLKLGCLNLDIMPPSKLDLTVVLALPRPKVLRRLIMDMTAIGVAEIILVNSYRTDKSYWQSPMLNRIDEFVTEGLQQGVDTIAPNIQLKKRFKPFVEDELSLWAKDRSLVVAHPYSPLSFNQYIEQSGLPQVLCIGAEGGWIDYEVGLLQEHGCQPIHIGSRILRTEAAVNVLCGRYL